MINNFKEKLNVRENELYEAIESKNISIERLQELSKLIKNEYKNEEITEKFIKKLYFLYNICQYSDKKIDTKKKLIRVIFQTYRDTQINCYTNNVVYFNDFFKNKEGKSAIEELYTDFALSLIGNSNIYNKKIYLNGLNGYIYYDETAKDSVKQLISVNVFYCDSKLLTKEIYTCEEIMEMLLSKKIIIKNINYELLDDKNSNIAKNINERINENQIKNIKKYPIANYVDCILQNLNPSDIILNITYALMGDNTKLLGSKKVNSEIIQLYPNINKVAYNHILKMIDKQIINQYNEIREIKQKHNKFVNDMISELKNRQEEIKNYLNSGDAEKFKIDISKEN